MSIKVNIGGEIFETTVSTLKKINYFKYILEDTNYDNTQIIFVDRSKHIFKHVLALAINPNYKYPLKYQDELDFYDVTYDVNNLYDPNNKLHRDMHSRLDKLEKKLNIGLPHVCKKSGCEIMIHKSHQYCDTHKYYRNKCVYEFKYTGNICAKSCDNAIGHFMCEEHRNRCGYVFKYSGQMCGKNCDNSIGHFMCDVHR